MYYSRYNFVGPNEVWIYAVWLSGRLRTFSWKVSLHTKYRKFKCDRVQLGLPWQKGGLPFLSERKPTNKSPK